MISCLGDYFNSAKTKPQQGLSFDRSPNQADNQLRRRTISLDFTAISPPDLQPNEERRLSFDEPGFCLGDQDLNWELDFRAETKKV